MAMNLLYIYIGNPSKQEEAFCQEQAKKRNVNITTLALSGEKGGMRRVLAALMTRLPSKKYDVVVTTEYFAAFGINLKLFLLRTKIKHIVFGINQSARLLIFGSSVINKIVNKVFNQASLYITCSRTEMALFNRIHDIDLNKFVFSHWGFDLPPVKNDLFANRKKDYIAFVGRNNRDVKTFCDALLGMDINGIIITAKYNKPDFSLPENVEIHYDLDMDSCLSCIRHSKINAVLVNDDDRGAGHITIVAAMLMNKPQIISDVSVIKEYFVDGVHGVSVPVADVESVKQAIVKLQNEDFYLACGKQANEYAKKYFTNDSSSERFIDVAQAVANNQKPDVCNVQWLQEFNKIS